MGLFDSRVRSKRLSNIVRIDSPENARKAVAELQREFEKGNRKRKLHVRRAASLAANRAEAFEHRKNLSETELGEMRQVATIYRAFAERTGRMEKLKLGTRR